MLLSRTLSRNKQAVTDDTSRVETFSDGVFAIIITLLALNIEAPQIPANATPWQVMLALRELWPNLVGFTLGFTFIAIIWVNHHRFFASVCQTSLSVLWLNNLLLFFVCLIPFSVAFFSRNPAQPLTAACLGSVFFLCSLAFTLLVYRVVIRESLIQDDIPESERWNAFRRTATGPVIYLIATLCSLVSGWVSLSVQLIGSLYFALPLTILTRQQLSQASKQTKLPTW